MMLGQTDHGITVIRPIKPLTATTSPPPIRSRAPQRGTACKAMSRIMLRPVGSPIPLGFSALGAASVALSGLQLSWVPQDESHQIAIVVLTFAVPAGALGLGVRLLVP